MKRLSAREKTVLVWGGSVAVGLLAYSLLLSPAVERLAVLEKAIAQKEKDLQEIRALRKDYAELQGRLRQIDGRVSPRGNFSLLTFLEGVANQTQVRTHIASMRPQASPLEEGYQESSVEMRIDNITLQQMVDFLSSVEGSQHLLRIKRLQIKTKFANPKFLDAQLIIATYEKSS